MLAIGLDIGNETCFVAVAKSGGIEVIHNEYSVLGTPSYVGFSEKSRDVGELAKLKLVPNVHNTIFGFKTILGKKYNNISEDIFYSSFNLIELQNGEFGVQVKYLREEVVFSVQQIMAMLITKLKNLAESKLGAKIRECVISVPVYYTDSQRRAMLDSAEIAGLKVIKLINEPTAVALSYGFYRQHLFNDNTCKTVVFVDHGQSSLTVTVCYFTTDKLKVLGSVWNTKVGGRDFDGVLVKYFAEDFKYRYQLDVMSSKKATMHLMLECEELKKQMSTNSRELELNIVCFMNDIDVKGKMKRALFEKLASHLFLDIEATMQDLFTQTGLNKEAINEVQIVGGSCQIPALKNIIQRVFGQCPQSTLNQDEAVARGCALECVLLSPALITRDYIIEDLQPLSIRAVCRKSTVEDKVELFPRFHKVPSTKTVTYLYKTPFQLEILYSNSLCSFSKIGKYTFHVPVEANANTDDDVQIRIKMSLDIHGVFNVTSATLVIKAKGSADAETKHPVPEVTSSYDESTLENTKGLPDMAMETDKEANTTKYFDLTIKEDVRSLSRDHLNIFMQKEREMINVDLKQKEMADLRNVVLECVFYLSRKLSRDLKNYLSEMQLEHFSEILSSIMKWLYDCKDYQDTEYLRLLNEMKERIEQWYSQVEDAKPALDTLRKVHEFFVSVMSSFPQETHPLMGNNNKNALLDLWKSGNESFDRWFHALKEVKQYGDLPIAVKDILDQMNSYKTRLDEKVQNIINKPDHNEFIACDDSSKVQNQST